MSEEDLVPLSTNINPFNVQVGGDHYKDCAIQPTVYSHYNNLNTCEANIVKYITRHNKKGEGNQSSPYSSDKTTIYPFYLTLSNNIVESYY